MIILRKQKNDFDFGLSNDVLVLLVIGVKGTVSSSIEINVSAAQNVLLFMFYFRLAFEQSDSDQDYKISMKKLTLDFWL